MAPRPACQPDQACTTSADRAPTMTSSEYPSGPQPVTLLDRFDKLKLEGWMPSQAVEILSLLHLCGHFHTPFAAVGPSAVGFWLGPNSNLVVRSEAGELDPSKIPTRDPGFYDPKPTPFTMPAFNSGLLGRSTTSCCRPRS